MFVLTGSPVVVLSLIVFLVIALFNEPLLPSLVFITGLVYTIGLGLAFLQPEVFASFLGRVSESYENVGVPGLQHVAS